MSLSQPGPFLKYLLSSKIGLCCRIKYYNNCLFHNIQRDFIAQTGDPTGTGKDGESISGCVYVPCVSRHIR